MSRTRIVIDLEMNPIAKKKYAVPKVFTNEVIEIGAVKIDENNCIISSFRCFVRPQYSKSVEQRITRLTGISMTNLLDAPTFADAVAMLTEWIGDDDAEIYSWSFSDKIQLESECRAKGVPFPHNMENWIDFQPMFAKKMGYDKQHSQMALRKAAEIFGIDMDKGHAHSALYDAKTTAMLLIHVLNDDCAEQAERFKVIAEEEEHVGTALGGILAKLKFEPEDAAV